MKPRSPQSETYCERLRPSRPPLFLIIPLKRRNRGIRHVQMLRYFFIWVILCLGGGKGLPGVGTGSGSHEQGVRTPLPLARPLRPPLHLLHALRHCAKVEKIFVKASVSDSDRH